MILAIFNPVTLLLLFYVYARLEKTSVFYWPVLVIGAAVDLVVNQTWFAAIFFELPKEYLLTQRVERLKTSEGYRGKLANALCLVMNRIQPGHCK